MNQNDKLRAAIDGMLDRREQLDRATKQLELAEASHNEARCEIVRVMLAVLGKRSFHGVIYKGTRYVVSAEQTVSSEALMTEPMEAVVL